MRGKVMPCVHAEKKRRIGINGFGRIGRLVFRVMLARPEEFEVAAINDLTDAETLAYLLEFDSIYGPFEGKVGYEGNSLIVNGQKIAVYAQKDPSLIPWDKEGVDFAVESTGVFTKAEQLALHLKAGAKKVILSAPAKGKVDLTAVVGVNDHLLKAEHKILSNASCTTNCLAPICKSLSKLGIERGLLTTIHAYTNDQKIHDVPHGKDKRRGRAAHANMIPTSTGAASAVGEVLPEMVGKFDGVAIRVPVIDGSLVDLTVDFKQDVTAEQINELLENSKQELKGVLRVEKRPIVSSDVIGDPYSSIVDAELTQVINGKMAKVFSWYDNEWGYSNRLVDLLAVASNVG